MNPSVLNIFGVFLQYGAVGAVAVLAIYWAIKKDRENTQLHQQMQAKTELFVEKYQVLSAELNGTIKDLISTPRAQALSSGTKAKDAGEQQ